MNLSCESNYVVRCGISPFTDERGAFYQACSLYLAKGKVKALQEMLVLISKPINFQLPFFLTQAAVTCPVSLVST